MNAAITAPTTETLATLADASKALAKLKSTAIAEPSFTSYVDALRGSKLDFEVQGVPLYAPTTGEGISSPILWDGVQGNRRVDTGAQLGVVGGGYRIVQNLDVARGLDALMAPLGGIAVARPSRVRAYDNGRICSMFLDLPPQLSALLHVGAKDRASTRTARLVARWAHDGSMAVCLDAFVFRLICENGMEVEGIESFRMKHTLHVDKLDTKLALWMHKVGEGYKAVGERHRALAGRTINASELRSIVMEVLDPEAKETRQAKAKVDSVIEMVEGRNGEFVPTGDVTLYTLLEAFTAYDAHRVPVRGNDEEAQERRELNVLRGEGIANHAERVLFARV